MSERNKQRPFKSTNEQHLGAQDSLATTMHKEMKIMEFICAHQPQTIRASEDSCFANFRQAVNISVLNHVHSSLYIWGVYVYLICVCAHWKSHTLAWLEILNCLSGLSAL